MCKITEAYTPDEPVQGFKVAVKIEDRYLSPATGIEYKPGPVEMATFETVKSKPRVYGGFRDDLLDPKSLYYKREYKGLTAVFANRRDARRLREALATSMVPSEQLFGEFVVVSMTLSDVRYKGTYDVSFDDANLPVVMGANIISIEDANQ